LIRIAIGYTSSQPARPALKVAYKAPKRLITIVLPVALDGKSTTINTNESNALK
jgi:hypothetical protein